MPLKSLPLRSLMNCALSGASASLALAFVEWIDINIQLTPVFRDSIERLILTAYMSLNLVVGALIGAVIGLVGIAGAQLVKVISKAIARRAVPSTRDRVLALFVVGLAATILFSLQPQIRAYVSGLTIEAQKLPYIYGRLLRFEQYLVPLIIFLLLVVCWLTSWISRAALRPGARIGWQILMLAIVAIAYYVDSRYQVQLYEYTLHRSMFLLAQGAAMTLFASLYFSTPRVSQAVASTSRLATKLRVGLSLAIVGAVAFTFFHFGRNQNLKVQLFTRTTQAKQHFKLAQWALDFDRDGYSASLGGGDADDLRGDINPAQKEIPEDGIDNNQLGGDLSSRDIEDWFRERGSAVHGRFAAASSRLNIVYIFIDAARADHFGAYGYDRDTTPNLDKLASKSVVFENGFSPAANTFESAARFMKSSYWDAPVETWTEVLSRNGYDAILFPERRLSMLERYVKGARVAPNSEGTYLKASIDVAIDTLGKAPAGQPFCAYIYAVEPHMPYAPHNQFNFGASLTDLYDGELAFTDHHLGRLFDWLEQSGRMNDTMIVVMADHGESLGERGVYRHSSQLYNEQAHVPIIFYLPTIAPRRVSDYVSTIDIGTTILDCAGIPCPEKYTGATLLPLMRGEPFVHPPIYAEQTLREKEFPNLRPDQYPQPELKKYMILTSEGQKLIYNREYQTFELFDLKNDPAELNNLIDYTPQVAAHLKRELGRFIDIVSVMRPETADERKYRFGADRDTTD